MTKGKALENIRDILDEYSSYRSHDPFSPLGDMYQEIDLILKGVGK